jgi:RNA polymerase sigma-70 factor (ECF subfamily)
MSLQPAAPLRLVASNPKPDAVTFSDDDRGFVYAVARRIVRSDEDAADVTQDALLLAFRHRHTFRGDSRYRTWLYRIASTTALSHLRRAKRSREELTDPGTEAVWEARDPAPSPETIAASRERAAATAGALRKLGAGYRDVLMMRADDTPEAEIARKLGLTVGNVKIRTHRARQQLRAALAI